MMVSPFDNFGLPNNTTDKGHINAPLPFLPIPLPAAFHGGKSGNKAVVRAKNALEINLADPVFIAKLKSLGKVPAGKSTRPIQFMIYNDASRPPHETEDSEVFYAKFVEYGFNVNGEAPYFHEGLHLWMQVRKFLARKLVSNYKKMPRRYTRNSVVMAMRDAVEETVLKLMSLTPVDTNLMKNSWKYEQIK